MNGTKTIGERNAPRAAGSGNLFRGSRVPTGAVTASTPIIKHTNLLVFLSVAALTLPACIDLGGSSSSARVAAVVDLRVTDAAGDPLLDATAQLLWREPGTLEGTAAAPVPCDGNGQARMET